MISLHCREPTSTMTSSSRSKGVVGERWKLKKKKFFFSSRYEIQFFSPQKNLEQIRARLPVQFPCLVAVGGDESDEFRRQTDEFHQVCNYDVIMMSH